MDPQDLMVFQLKYLSSVTPNVPLADNLKALMAPALGKLKDYCRARIAAHVFINPEVRELDAMVVGASPATAERLSVEMRRRHRPGDQLTPTPGLPEYVKGHIASDGEAQSLFRRDQQQYSEALGGPLLTMLNQLYDARPLEFDDTRPQRGDSVIVVPLAMGEYRRLGWVVAWAPGGALQQRFGEPRHAEALVAFRTCLEQILVRVFTNFYRMEPHTYLPSYYRAEAKPVTLLCVELWNFERVAAILGRREDLDAVQKRACLSRLLSRFTETAAELIELHRGRVDQIWGSGLLGVFGEYLDSADFSPRPGCKRAITAAAHMVSELRKELERWLDENFLLARYRRRHTEDVRIASAIAVDHAEVFFDYVGSRNQRIYMAVGDRVDFVKRLAGLAGGANLEPGAASDAPLAIRPGAAPNEPDGPPILLSQSAHEWSFDILRDRMGAPTYAVHRGKVIRFPGVPGEHLVYPIHPDNIETAARASP